MDDVTKTDVRRAMQALGEIPDLEQAISIAKACGVDCTELDGRCKWAKEILTRFVEMHGPIMSDR